MNMKFPGLILTAALIVFAGIATERALADWDVIYEDDFAGSAGDATNTVPLIEPDGFQEDVSGDMKLSGDGKLYTESGSGRYAVDLGSLITDNPGITDIRFEATIGNPTAQETSNWLGMGFSDVGNNSLSTSGAGGPWFQIYGHTGPGRIQVRGGPGTDNGTGFVSTGLWDESEQNEIDFVLHFNIANQTASVQINGTYVEFDDGDGGTTTQLPIIYGDGSDEPPIRWAHFQWSNQFEPENGGGYVSHSKVSVIEDIPDPVAGDVFWNDDFSGADLNSNFTVNTLHTGNVTQDAGQLILDTGSTTAGARAQVSTATDQTGERTEHNGELLYNFYAHPVRVTLDIDSIAGQAAGPNDSGRIQFYFSIGEDSGNNHLPTAIDNGIGFILEQLDTGSGLTWRLMAYTRENNSHTGGTAAVLSGVPTGITFVFDGTMVKTELTGAEITQVGGMARHAGIGGATIFTSHDDISGNISQYSFGMGARNHGSEIVDGSTVALNSLKAEVIDDTITLAGTSEAFADSYYDLDTVKLNFAGTEAALYLGGHDQRNVIAKETTAGNMFIDGEPARDPSFLTYENVTLDEAEWTRISVFETGKVDLPPVDTSTLDGKLVTGYQGWFTAPGDDGFNTSWIHWTRGNDLPDGSNMSIDLYPDLSEYGDDELFETAMTIDGEPAYLYSGHLYKTIRRHVRWMQEYGIDGAMVQQFVVQTQSSSASMRRFKRNTLLNFKTAAEEFGRGFAVMYDIAGVQEPLQDWWDGMRDHWMDLVDEGVVGSDSYFHHDGRPVVGIWGFGFRHIESPADPQDAIAIIEWFQEDAPEQYRATVFGGVPGLWREQEGESKTSSGWADVYRAFDIISPWTVGRYRGTSEADDWKNNQVDPDIQEAADAGIGYCPVIWPGFSWHNLKDGDSPQNWFPREGGEFFWRQAYNVIDAFDHEPLLPIVQQTYEDVKMIYLAMFDEVDESTAIYKVAPTQDDAPDQGYWLTLDADGYSLPSDWYLRLSFEIGHMLRGDKTLTSTRPSDPGPHTTLRGTPISWLESHGLITDGFEAADIEDSDGSGFKNWEEYLAGTNPNDPDSHFHVIDVDRSNEESVVSWYGTDSGSDLPWSMYGTTNLIEGWTLIESGTIPRDPQGTGTNTWTETSDQPFRYYQPAVIRP